MAGRGGFMPGGGRPKGSKSKTTIEKEHIRQEIHQRVLKGSKRIINSQFNLANGCSFLYRIDKDEKGHNSKPVLVKDQAEIETYLSGEYDEEDTYYFITTEKPDIRAIQDLWDRVIGKPPQVVQGDEDAPIYSIVVNRFNPNDNNGKTSNKPDGISGPSNIQSK
jgi:hypothetical protein